MRRRERRGKFRLFHIVMAEVKRAILCHPLVPGAVSKASSMSIMSAKNDRRVGTLRDPGFYSGESSKSLTALQERLLVIALDMHSALQRATPCVRRALTFT